MSPSGAVRVQVVDETGKPISPARVFISQALPSTATRPPAPPVITGPQVGTAYTDQNGHFVAFLPAGSYIACAETTTQGVLDPCHWATSAPTFTIKSQSTVETTVTMAAGAIVPIQVNDPNQLLPPATLAVQPECRFQMVTAAGRRYDAVIVGHSSTSRSLSITIPFGTALTLQPVCPGYVVNDSTGKPAAAAGYPTQLPQGATAATINFTVSGVKP